MDIDNEFNLTPIPAKDAWELEYQNQTLLSPDDVATIDSRNFLKFYFNSYQEKAEAPQILDLGCGLGKTLRFAKLNFSIGKSLGVDLSLNAIGFAEKLSKELSNLNFIAGNLLLAETWEEINKNKWDIAILGTFFHLFNEEEKKYLLKELKKVLKPNALIYLRTFILDGDKNAKNLIKLAPGPEKNSYLHPGLYVYEYLLEKKAMISLWQEFGFRVVFEKTDFSYQKWQNQSYKRKSIIMYLQYDAKK